MRSKWASIFFLVCLVSAAHAQPVFTDISYGSHQAQKLDIYPSAKGNSPIVILIHGGAWYGGSKSDLADLAKFLQQQDYTVASIDYRVSWQATFPANIQDVSCAIAYLKRNASAYRADPSRVALLGYSAGGHLAMLQATAGAKYLVCDPPAELDIDGVIGVCGIYSFKHRVVADPDRLLQMLGDSARYWNEADPIQHLDDINETKFLLITDAVDAIVPPENTYDLYGSLRGRGVPVELRTFYTKDHLNILSTVTTEDSVMASITTFLDSLWPPQQAVLDTEHYDVDIRFSGRQIDVFSRHEGRVVLYDLLGRVVTQFDMPAGRSHYYLWNVPYGCYFVSVIENTRRTTVRVILD